MRLLSLFLLFPVLQLFGQTTAIKGKVQDKNSGESLVGALVMVQDQMVATDLDGLFYMEVAPGKTTLTISFTGYNAETLEVMAQEGQVSEVEILLYPLSIDLGMAVVSAGKFEQDVTELTVSMEVIQPKIIGDKNTVQIDDILQQTPGVIIVDGEPQIRSGSGYSFGAGSRVMVLVDDLPILSGDAGRPSWGFLPVENVEQIEIIKGASSVLYGSAALSGVINIRTAFPSGKPKTKVIVFHGLYSDPQTSAGKYWDGSPMMSGINFFHSHKIGPLSIVVGGSFLADDGYLGPIVDENGEQAPSTYTPFEVNRYGAVTRGRMNVNLRVQSKKVEGLSYGLNTNWLLGESVKTLLWGNDSLGLYSAFDGAATRTKQLVANVDPYVEYLSPKGYKHSLKNRWQKLDNNNDNNQGNYSDVYYSEYQIQKTFSQEEESSLTATGGLVSIFTRSEAELYSGGSSDGMNAAKNFAAYLQLDDKVNEALNLSAGVRYEYFDINGNHEGRPVFRGGANLHVGRATYLRSSFGQGFRFPTIAERYIRTSVGAINIYPSEDLSAERSYNAELGVKQGIKLGTLKGFLDVALFQQEYKDFIEFTFGQWNANPSTSNLFGLGFKSLNTGKSRIRGLDISVVSMANLGEFGLRVLAGYTYTQPVSLNPDFVYAQSQVDSTNLFFIESFKKVSFANTSSDAQGDILKYRLQHLFRADVSLDWKKWNMGVSFRANSRMQNIDRIYEDLDDPNISPNIPLGIIAWREKHTTGDFVLDVRCSYGFKDSHKVAIIVGNLLNREYAIRPLAIESPRTTTIQYTLEF